MQKFIIRWAIAIVGLYVAVWLVDGVELESQDALTFIWLALIFGLLNALVRPLLKLLTCPVILLTLGLGIFLVNTAMLYLTAWVAGLVGIGFTLSGFWAAFLGALVISVVSLVLGQLLKDEIDRKK